MTTPSILVAGIGNIFLGDDAFGVEVARRLAALQWPDGVRVKDFGIRGLDLAYAILDGHDAVILVDATSRGEEPGTLFVIEPDLAEAEPGIVEAHAMTPANVIRLVASMGGTCGRMYVVGCEPMTFGPDDEGMMGLSAPVEAALEGAVEMVESLVARIRRGAAVSAAT